MQRGFAFVLVIWALVLMTGLSSGFALAVRHEIRSAQLLEDQVAATGAGIAALNHLAYQWLSRDRRARSSGEQTTSLQLPGAHVQLRVRPDNARIDLNLAPRELLAGLFAQLAGVTEPFALADAVIDWRDADDDPEPAGAEARAYAAAGYPYGPANRPFSSVHELGRVIGFDAAMAAAAAPYLTIYSRRAGINAVGADLVVLSAVPGVEQADAEAFIAHRAQVATEGGNLDYSLLQGGIRYVTRRASTRILAVDLAVRLDNGHVQRERAVIRVDRTRGFTLLAQESVTDLRVPPTD